MLLTQYLSSTRCSKKYSFSSRDKKKYIFGGVRSTVRSTGTVQSVVQVSRSTHCSHLSRNLHWYDLTDGDSNPPTNRHRSHRGSNNRHRCHNWNTKKSFPVYIRCISLDYIGTRIPPGYCTRNSFLLRSARAPL